MEQLPLRRILHYKKQRRVASGSRQEPSFQITTIVPTLLGLRVERLPEVMGRARLRRMPGLGNVIQWYDTGHCAVRKQYHIADDSDEREFYLQRINKVHTMWLG